MAPRLVPQIKASLSRIDLTGASALTRKIINEGRDFALLPNFITEEEHSHIAEECRRVLERMSFTPDHFDSVISHYREVIATRFSDRMPILYRLYREKIAEQFFTIDRPLAVDDPHVLELSPNGHIRPHLDQVSGTCPHCRPLRAGSPPKLQSADIVTAPILSRCSMPTLCMIELWKCDRGPLTLHGASHVLPPSLRSRRSLYRILAPSIALLPKVCVASRRPSARAFMEPSCQNLSTVSTATIWHA